MNRDVSTTDELACPTCGARQIPADACRRCRCDLRLVAGLHREIAELHHACLWELGSGEKDRALAAALRRWEILPDRTSQRLLAVAFLVLGRSHEALETYDAKPSV